MLRAIVRGIMTNYTPKQAVILLVDYQRGLLGYVNTDHLLGYAVSSNQLTAMITDVHGSMQRRVPRSDTSQEQLRHRSWWQGPELFVIVDDYDLVATASGNPLRPLAEFLPQAKDLGLHLVIARHTGGASRATFDPVIGRLKEISTPGFVGSGSRDEGELWGTVRPNAQLPGRGVIVNRKQGGQRMQTAWVDQEPPALPVTGDVELEPTTG
jgi:S-DNA-T family DNA segregation ATPase FtsK/SpoIIIE